MPSIVDPAVARGGAWTVTRGLIKAINTALPRAEVECIAVPARSRGSHLLRQVIGISRSMLGHPLPAKGSFTRTRKFRRELDTALAAGRPDLVIINGTDLFWVLDVLPKEMPVIAVAQNIEQELYARQVERAVTRWPLAERILESDLAKLRRYEWNGMRNAGRVIFLSEEDRMVAMGACPEIESMTMPPVFDYEPARRAEVPRERIRIGMFADFTWWPNRVSLDWFLSEVWRSVSGNLELHLIGHGSDGIAKTDDRVVTHGTVQHARDAFAMCDLMIAPIVDGAGVKVKVAEALYNRVPMVATPLAVRGLLHTAIPAIHICDSADEWIGFLNSDSPRDLATRIVPVDVAAWFSTHRVADMLGEFLAAPSSRPAA